MDDQILTEISKQQDCVVSKLQAEITRLIIERDAARADLAQAEEKIRRWNQIVNLLPKVKPLPDGIAEAVSEEFFELLQP